MANGKPNDVYHVFIRLINSAVYFLNMPLYNYSHFILCIIVALEITCIDRSVNFGNTSPVLLIYTDYCIEIVLIDTEWFGTPVLAHIFLSRLTNVIKVCWIMFPKNRCLDLTLCHTEISIEMCLSIEMDCCWFIEKLLVDRIHIGTFCIQINILTDSNVS